MSAIPGSVQQRTPTSPQPPGRNCYSAGSGSHGLSQLSPPRTWSRWERLRNVLCSLSTLVTLVYFALLCVTAIITITTTRLETGKTLLMSWNSTHATQTVTAQSFVDNAATLLVRGCKAAAGLYTQSMNPVESNKTLTMLCSELGLADTRSLVRALSMISVVASQYAMCSHADPKSPTPATLSALMSDAGRFNGLFYFNPRTFTYDDPPLLKAPTRENLTASAVIDFLRTQNATIDNVLAHHNGTRASLAPTDLLSEPPSQANIIYYTYPVFGLGNSAPLNPAVYPTDTTQMRIDAATLLQQAIFTNTAVSVRDMALTTPSLGTDDPLVLSNNWRQQIVFHPRTLLQYPSYTTYR